MCMVKRWVTSCDSTWIGSKRRIQAIRDRSEGVWLVVLEGTESVEEHLPLFLDT